MAATPRVPKIRAYKDILTPALHKRFASGSLKVLLPACYVISVAIGEKNSWFWTWFPLGRAGIRTGLLFICVLAICILRVSQWHIGIRTTKSPYQTFVRHWFRFETVQTALHYLFSAWWFCEVCKFSASRDANIYWLAQGKIYERQRLNERAIYLMSFHLLCALLQAVYHILGDFDRIDISADPEVKDDQEVVKAPSAKIQEKLLATLVKCFTKALIMASMSPFIYSLFIRQTAWKYTLAFAKVFWNLPKTSTLPVTWPFHIWILARTLVGGFLLFALWDISNLAFSAYVGQPPVKNGKPITDGSNDPNGSLLNGLKSRKMMNKAYAFWELQRITQGDQVRRKTMYEEIERKGGSTWEQTYKVCTDAVDGLNARLADYLKPPTPTKADYDNLNKPPREESSPKVGTPLKDDDIINKPKTSSNLPNVGRLARSLGQSSSPYNAAREILDKGTATLKKYDAENTLKSTWGVSQGFAIGVLKSYIGWPFRQTAERRALSVVLGSPYSEQILIVSAIKSLTQLALCSLEEDGYGKVQRKIRDIFQLFTTTVENLEAVEMKLLSEIHWTDVEFEEGTEIPEIEMLLKELRASLQDLIAAFANYSDAMTLDSRIMRKAREAAVDTRPKKKNRGEKKGPGGKPRRERPSPSEKEKEKEKEKEREKKEREKKAKEKENQRKSGAPPEMSQSGAGRSGLAPAAGYFMSGGLGDTGGRGRSRTAGPNPDAGAGGSGGGAQTGTERRRGGGSSQPYQQPYVESATSTEEGEKAEPLDDDNMFEDA